MLRLANSIFSLDIDAQTGEFSIHTLDPNLPSLKRVRLGCIYHRQKRRFERLTSTWQGTAVRQAVVKTVEHGDIEEIGLLVPDDENGIGFQVTFGIVQEYPLVIWKVSVVNHGSLPVELEKIDLLRISPEKSGQVVYAKARVNGELGFYTNGWQSWSHAGWYSADSRMNISRLGFLQHPMIYNSGTPLPRKRGEFSSDMFAVVGDHVAQTGFLVGFLSQKNHFGSIYSDFNQGNLRMWANGDDARLDPGYSIETDWAVFNPILLNHRDPMGKYLEAVARANHVRIPQEAPVGWCSWYHFYTKVTADDVERNLKSIVDMQEKLPIQLVQLDDGFESHVGDWFSFKPGFAQGVAPLAEKITGEGLIPGLWLAPFIVNPRSELMRNHPDWILKKIIGRPVNAGYNWDVLTTGLDMTVPDALHYVCDVVRTASAEWGYTYLKLDFYYAAGVKGKYYDPTLTRAQVLRRGMEAIREAVGPDIKLLGCGAPLGSMVGVVDFMRIGADVSGDWAPRFRGISAFLKNEPSFPCARNSIRNILTRAALHKQWWINDPDCLLIRPDTNLSFAEVRSLATAISLTGGSLLLSDDLPKLPAERLRIAQVLIPVIGERARVMDWFSSEMPKRLRLDLFNELGEWHILAYFNWNEKPIYKTIVIDEFDLAQGEYWVREFWGGKVGELSLKQPFITESIPSHGCAVLAVRRKGDGTPTYLGGDLHISQGLEISQWNVSSSEVQFTLRLPRKDIGNVLVYVPGKIVMVKVNEVQVAFIETTASILKIPVEVDGFAHVTIIRE